MKSFRKLAGIIALMAAILALVSCDAFDNFIKSEYPEFPANLRGNWKREAGGTETRRIDANTFSFGNLNIRLILSSINGNKYSMRTPSGSSPNLTMTKTLVIENGNLVISGCTEESCGKNCNGIWIK